MNKKQKYEYLKTWIDKLRDAEITKLPKKYRSKESGELFPHDCYEQSFNYLEDKKDMKNIKLVHGLIGSYYHAHAWVEINENIVFDGVLQRFYEKEKYYLLNECIKVKEYTFEEARREVCKYGMFDLWGWNVDDYLIEAGLMVIYDNKIVIK